VSRNPKLHLHGRFTHVAFNAEAALLIADDDTVLLDFPVAADLVPLIDGGASAAQIAETLADRHSPALVHFALLALYRAGLTVETDDRTADERRQRETRGSAAEWEERLHDAWAVRSDSQAVSVRLEPPQSWHSGTRLDVLLTDDSQISAICGWCPRMAQRGWLSAWTATH
jgi:hypothetical protein